MNAVFPLKSRIVVPPLAANVEKGAPRRQLGKRAGIALCSFSPDRRREFPSGDAAMGAFDEDAEIGAKRPKPPVHEIGQALDDLSQPELAERIETLKREIARLESAMKAREATRHAASAFFKS
jgi:uncharacterized small protein (DUF1192 family)